MKTRKAKAAAVHATWRVDIEIFFLIGIVLATLLLVSPAMAQEGTAKIRMAHLSPDAPAVMVELDGEPVEALANVSYRDSTGYLDIPAGPHDVAVFATADPSEPVLEVSIAPEAGEAYTVAGVGLLADETFGARLFEDDLSDPDEGEAHVRVIHAVPDVGPATVSVAGGPDLFTLPGFANASDYVGVDEGTYTLEVTPAGAPEPAFDVPDVAVEAGETYTAFAIGQASEGTLDTMLTVDSDNGRVVGPQTLEDTSGDLSLLEEPQAESAPASNDRVGDLAKPADSSKPKSAKSTEEPEKTPEPSQTEPSQTEEAPAQSAPVAPEYVAPEYVAPEYVAPEYVAPAYTAPAEPAPAYIAPAYTAPAEPAPAYTAPAPAEIVVPTAAEVSPEPLVAAPAVAPQPVQTVPVAPQIPAPSVPAPSVPAPSVPTVDVSAAVPAQVPVSAQAIASSVNASANATANAAVSEAFAGASSNTSATASGVVAEGFVPAAPHPVSGGSAPAPVVDPVVAFVSNTPAVVNSGARRKFVTIRKAESSSE